MNRNQFTQQRTNNRPTNNSTKLTNIRTNKASTPVPSSQSTPSKVPYSVVTQQMKPQNAQYISELINNPNIDRLPIFPKYVINHTEGLFADVTITLNKDQVILADGGSMSFMSANMGVQTSAKNGIWSGLQRAFTGETFFMNIFGVERGEKGKITLCSTLPGDVKCLRLKANSQILLAPGTYIASTINTKVEARRRLRGIFFGAGLTLVEITADKQDALIWCGGFGAIKEHRIKAGDEFIVEFGRFFASKGTTDYEIVTLKNVMSIFFSGQSVMLMKFTGPCVVYTQSRSIQQFTNYMGAHIPRSSGSSNSASSLSIGPLSFKL